jgi:hypothetical protein
MLMLKSRKKTGKEMLLTGAFAIALYLLVLTVNSAIVLVGANLALRPWTAQRIDYWAAMGLVLLISVLRDAASQRKAE